MDKWTRSLKLRGLIVTILAAAIIASLVWWLFVSLASPIPQRRAVIVQRLTDQTVLARIALNDSSWQVRLAAVGELTDQGVLGKIALDDSRLQVRLAAADKLTDQPALAEVAISRNYRDVRRAAVEKLTDEAVIAYVAINAIDVEVRLTVAEKLTDQAVLSRIALNDSDRRVRLAAIKKLTDQAVLAEIAMDHYKDLRLAAVGELTDQAVLAQIALNDRDSSVRLAAVGELTDQDTLAKVAINAGESSVRLAAVKKLTGQAALAQVAIISTYNDIRSAAARKLTDETALAEVAFYCSSGLAGDSSLRSAAFAKLTEEGLLRAALQTDDLQKRAGLIALAKFSNAAESIPQEHRLRILSGIAPLATVFCEPPIISHLGSLHTVDISWTARRMSYSTGPPIDGERIVFTATFSGISHEITANWSSSFSAVAPHDQIWHSAYISTSRVIDPIVELLASNQHALAEIAEHAHISCLREAAVGQLCDQGVLARIALNDSNGRVRGAAESRLAK